MSRPDPVTREMSPCNGCTERFPACHGRCPKDERGEFGYKEWRKKIDSANEARREYNFKAAIFSKIT